MKLQKAFAVIGAGVLLFAASDAITFAATGSSLVLGKINTANATTTIQNTGTTPALKLLTKGTATAPMIVNGKGKVTNLYADRAATADNASKLGGKTIAQVQAAAKGATGAQGVQGTKGDRGDTGVSGPQYGRPIVMLNTLDSTGDVGTRSSVTLGADGRAIIAYIDGTNLRLKVAHCADTACTSATTTVVDPSSPVGDAPSITIGENGLPNIAYSSQGTLKFATCGNLDCTAGNGIRTIGGPSAWLPSLAIGERTMPVISFYDNSDHHLKVIHCEYADCSYATIATVDSAGDVGWDSAMTIDTLGVPVIAYYDNTNGDLKVAHCNDEACSSVGTSAVDTLGNVGSLPSIAIGVDGLPIISYRDVTNGDLKVAHCLNIACTSAAKSSVVTQDDVGYDSSIVIGTDGLPLISYYAAGAQTSLMLARCATTSCTSVSYVTGNYLEYLSYYTSMIIGADGAPLITSYDSSTHDLKVAHISYTSWTLHGWGP
jgi:hypothetical protein